MSNERPDEKKEYHLLRHSWKWPPLTIIKTNVRMETMQTNNKNCTEILVTDYTSNCTNALEISQSQINLPPTPLPQIKDALNLATMCKM